MERIWRKSYDPGLTDLDPSEWENDYVSITNPTFQRFGKKAALCYMDVEITFEELDRYANRFANMLIASGLKKGDVVGINLPNIPEYVISWLGILRAGCAVSGVSPLLSPEEMVHQLSDCKAKGLVTLDAIFAGRLVKIADRLPDLKVVAAARITGFLPAAKKAVIKVLPYLQKAAALPIAPKKIKDALGKIQLPPTGKVTPLPGKTVYLMDEVIKGNKFLDALPKVDITPDDIAYVQYTGGTTGLPKGAQLSHRNSVADLLIVQRWLAWEGGAGLALSGFPFFHIAGLFFNINCIYLGWTQVLIPNPRDTDGICKQYDKYKPTALVNVPSLFQLLIANPKFKAIDHSGLETCISAASPFPEESQKELEAIVGKGKLLEVYGMTETSPLTVMNPRYGQKKLGSIGLPILNTDMKLLDPETGEEVGVNTPGEICVKGPQIMVGYFDKPDETAKTVDKDGYMHTGDVAVMDDDGFLRIVDRTKDMLIVGGFKVFSRKVEEVLCQHPAVDMIAITGEPNPERPGSELVKAFVTISPSYDYDGDQKALEASIIDLAKEKLAPYEIPKKVEVRTELPLTAVGKIDKKQLRKK
ncbi:MAG: AMP-binding protein [Deltaproteobacteria bacterium]|nr:AMP-binding protein [Deltaproteobacteria bacterium]